jgi:hypothetical protein
LGLGGGTKSLKWLRPHPVRIRPPIRSLIPIIFSIIRVLVT